eukprot:1591532-Alexandrium_andersonii.AAC.1
MHALRVIILIVADYARSVEAEPAGRSGLASFFGSRGCSAGHMAASPSAPSPATGARGSAASEGAELPSPP